MRPPKKSPKKCPIPDCQEVTPGGRMCSACKSWWLRIQLYTPTGLEKYLYRLSRFAGRSRFMGTRPAGVRHPRKKR